MENPAKISFSAVTHIGAACTVNDDRIYANGRFMHKYETDCTQISLDGSDSQFLFALADGMDTEESGVSIINDLKKYHQKIKSSSKDIQVKLNELVECVEQSSNLVYSVSLGESNIRELRTAFSGLLVDNGSIAAVNMGASRVYKLDGDNLKLIVNDYRKAERLLKMGIINDEQAEMLTGQNKSYESEGLPSVRKSDVYPLKERNVYLLCSRGLTDAVSEDTIYDILASSEDTDVIAEQLVEEAVNNESEDNITAVVVKINSGEPASRQENIRSIPTRTYSSSINRYKRPVRRRKVDVARLISALITVIVIAAIVFLAFTIWFKLRNPQDDLNASASTPTTYVSPTEDLTGNTGDLQGDITGNTEGTDNTGGTATASETKNITGGKTGTSQEGATTYEVKAGDSLMQISLKFYGTRSKYKLIMEANNITDADKIQVGQVLVIPASK